VGTDDLGCIVDVDTTRGIEPTWDLDRVRALVDGHYEGWLFVAGCVANQGVVAFLSARVDVHLARVVDVPNPFGSRPEQRAKIASDLAEFEPLQRAGAGHKIVATTAPLAEVVAVLERVAATVDRRVRGSR